MLANEPRDTKMKKEHQRRQNETAEQIHKVVLMLTSRWFVCTCIILIFGFWCGKCYFVNIGEKPENWSAVFNALWDDIKSFFIMIGWGIFSVTCKEFYDKRDKD